MNARLLLWLVELISGLEFLPHFLLRQLQFFVLSEFSEVLSECLHRVPTEPFWVSLPLFARVRQVLRKHCIFVVSTIVNQGLNHMLILRLDCELQRGHLLVLVVDLCALLDQVVKHCVAPDLDAQDQRSNQVLCRKIEHLDFGPAFALH